MPLSAASLVKPTHKAIIAYYDALKVYRSYNANHEGAVETAFMGLLRDTGKQHGWALIPKQMMQVGGKTIYPTVPMMQSTSSIW